MRWRASERRTPCKKSYIDCEHLFACRVLWYTWAGFRLLCFNELLSYLFYRKSMRLSEKMNVMEWNLRFAESVKFWCLKKNKKLDVTGNWTYTNHNCYLETSDFTDKAISWRDAGLAKQRWRSQRWWSEKIKRILTSFFKCKFTAWLLHFTWIGALLALKKVLWCKIFKFANLSPSPSYQIQNDEQTHTTLRRWQQPPK